MRTVTPAKQKVEMIPLSQIKNKFDVRVQLDNDRVLQFAGLYEGGAVLPPIEIVKLDEDEYAFIDGRTRAAARQYLNLKDVPAVVFNGNLKEQPVELFARALQANWGGAKPPTREDITHTVLRMIENGASDKEIKERLDFLPLASIRLYIAGAKSTLSKRRISRALDAVSEGVRPDTAAKQFKLKPEVLKDIIKGKKGKWGQGRSEETQIAVELKAYISRQLFSANAGIGKKLVGVLQKVEDGEMSVKTAEGVLYAYSEHLRKTAIRVDDWMARLVAISGEQEKVAVEK